MAENWRPLCDAERIKQIWTLFKESPGILRSLLCGGTDMNSVSLKSRLRNLAIKEKNRAFLAPLYEAIVRDERLIVNWNPEKAEWC